MSGLIAVLTGDIVKSSKLETAELELVRESLKAASLAAADRMGDLLTAPLSFYRGDGWQVALGRPSAALRMAVLLRASVLMGGLADTRVAIGLGRAGRVSSTDVGLSTGEAFTLSGRALEAMSSRSPAMAIALPVGVAATGWALAAVRAAAVIMDGWTARQAEIAALRLAWPDATLQEIGSLASPPVTHQAVSDSLHGAVFPALEALVLAFETENWTKVCASG